MSKVLVIDDTALVRESMAKLLEYEGYQTIRASNGREGWATLYNETPDLILLDLAMPQMDGIQFLQQLRKSPLWADLPVIVLTGKSDDQKLVSRAWELNIKELIPKASFGIEDLLAHVKKHVGGNGGPRTTESQPGDAPGGPAKGQVPPSAAGSRERGGTRPN